MSAHTYPWFRNTNNSHAEHTHAVAVDGGCVFVTSSSIIEQIVAYLSR